MMAMLNPDPRVYGIAREGAGRIQQAALEAFAHFANPLHAAASFGERRAPA